MLFIQVLEAIKAFDEKHKDDAAYLLAMDQSFNVLVFLWAASKHEIPSFNQISDSDDSSLVKWSKSMHKTSIINNQSDSDNPSVSESQVIQQLNRTVQNNTELFEQGIEESQV